MEPGQAVSHGRAGADGWHHSHTVSAHHKEKSKNQERGVLTYPSLHLANYATLITLRFAKRNRLANGARYAGQP